MITEDIINWILKKDKESFSIFYTQVVDSFFRYIKNTYNVNNSDIDDIISTVFYKIWNNLDKYDRKKGKFESWSWIILKNTTKDFFKKKKDLSFSHISGTGEDNDFNIEDTLYSEEDINELLSIQVDYKNIIKIMESLSSIDKEIVTLRFIEERTLEEISDIMGISNWNVRVKLHRVLKKIKWKIL